ncbi:MAG: hypothetical protein GWP15_00325 [Nitrospirae bacterium]|nr:hypothetical protein [Nitrospirota bacterium]
MKIRIFSLGIFSIIFFSALIYIGAFHSQNSANAATLTVCADVPGTCTYSTVTAAIAAATDGNSDVIDVQSGYVETGESFPLTVGKSVEIDCGDVETLGNISNSDVILVTDSNVTIENCELDKVEIRVSASDATLNSNAIDTAGATFFTTTGDAADNLTVTGNYALNGVWINGGIDGTNISNNTFEIRYKGTARQGISIEGMTSDTTINSNTVTNLVGTRANYNMIAIVGTSGNPVGTGNTITNNTIAFSTDPGSSSTGNMISANSAAAITISGNYISLPSTSEGSYAGISLISEFGPLTATVQNNTIKLSGTCGSDCRAISGGDYNTSNAVVLTAEYNIFYSLAEISGTIVEGMYIAKDHDDSTITITDNYNGYYNTTDFISESGTYSSEISTTATNRYTMNPGMMTEEVARPSTADDMNPFDGSCYLDVNGTTDIGAYSAVRRSAEGDGKVHIEVDDDGDIDYSTVDFNDIDTALGTTCSTGGSVDVAAGTYAEQIGFNTKTVDLIGAGSGSTTINSAGINSDPALFLVNVDDSTISGFTVTADATDTAALLLSTGSNSNTFTDLILSGITSTTTAYTKTYHPYEYNGTNYTAGSVILMFHAKTGVNADYLTVDENDEAITSNIDGTPQTWNLGLANNGSLYYSLYWDDNEYPSSTEALEELTALGGTWTVDCWADDVYVYANGAYGYTVPTVDATNCPTIAPTVITSGYQTIPATPAIRVSPNGNLYIASSDSNTFSSSTIQNSAYGISFAGTSASNTIDTTGITFTGNTTDLYTSSSGDNTITTNDSCASLTYTVGATGALTGCQTVPTGTLSSASQDSGENTVSVSFTANDPDRETLQAKLEYESDYDGSCDGPWIKANVSAATASSGTPSVDNSAGYQITSVTTSEGINTVSATWDANTNIGDIDGTHCLRLTVNDATTDQTTPSTKTVAYAYDTPTPAVETSGSSVGAFLSGLSSKAKKDTSEEKAEAEEEEEEVTEEEPTEEKAEEVEEPAPTPEEAIEELPTNTVIETVKEFVVEPVYDYFTEEQVPAEEPIEEPEEKIEYIEPEIMSELIESYETQEDQQATTVGPPAGPSVGEIISGGTPQVVNEITESIDIEEMEKFTAYSSEGTPITFSSDRELENFIEEEAEKVGAQNLDINNDYVADVVNLRFNVSLTDSNPDNDILPTAAEFFCGTDPNVADVNDWSKPIVQSVNNVTAGSKPEIRVCSIAGDTVDVVIMEKSQSEEILIGTASIDDGYKGSVKVQEDLEDGEYYLFAIGDKGTGVASLTVNSDEALEDLTIEIAKEKLILGAVTDGVVVIASKANNFEKDQYLDLFAGEAKESIVLTAEKDAIVYVTIQSRIFSSVVISDADGVTQIQPSLLAELPPGTHEIAAYSSDPETNRISNVISFIFTK